MSGTVENSSDWFVAARARLLKLASEWLVDDPGRGLVAVIPVQGGVFRHPLTGGNIDELTVYACGPDQVKLLSPRFLYSLPRLSLQRVATAPQFCALVAHRLGEQLGRLGQLRDRLLAMGVLVDLVPDALLLRGRVQLAGRSIGVAAWQQHGLMVESLDGSALYHLPPASRSLVLGGQPTADLDALARLVDKLAGAAAATPGEDILDLTETVEEPVAQAPGVPAAEALPAAGAPGEPSLGSLPLEELWEKLGSNTTISAHGGRLRFEVQLKVVQGQYRFFLEQRAPRRLAGYLVTPGGTRAAVDLELGRVLDLKEVLDAYLADG